MEIISVLRERAAELERLKVEALCSANFSAGALDELRRIMVLMESNTKEVDEHQPG